MTNPPAGRAHHVGANFAHIGYMDVALDYQDLRVGPPGSLREPTASST